MTSNSRERLRRRYRPDQVRILFVGESPPASGRFFYHADSGSFRRDGYHRQAKSETAANTCVEWLAQEPPNLDRARAAAARIDKYGNRATEIIDRMRSFI